MAGIGYRFEEDMLAGLNEATGWKIDPSIFTKYSYDGAPPFVDFDDFMHDIIRPQGHGFAIHEEYTAQDILKGMQDCISMSVHGYIEILEDKKEHTVRKVVVRSGARQKEFAFMHDEPDYFVHELMEFAGDASQKQKFMRARGVADFPHMFVLVPKAVTAESLEPYIYAKELRTQSRAQDT